MDESVRTVSAVALNINHALGQLPSGSLRFFGYWFGRPMDNNHVITDAISKGTCLILRFDQGESLRVWDPREPAIDSQLFTIATASRLRWEWFPYDGLQVPDRLHYRNYIMKENGLFIEGNDGTSVFNSSPEIHNSPAVALIKHPG